MDFNLTAEQEAIYKAGRELAGRFGDDYWRQCDSRHEFPWDFYNAFAETGWYGLIMPPEYGGQGLGITEAGLLLQAIAESGGGINAASTIHLTMFSLTPVLKHGTEEMKRKYVPAVIQGQLHVSFGVTERDAGTDTSRITTRAVREGDHYVVTGHKVWNTKAQQASKVLLLTRTTPREQVAKRTDGLTLFFADLDRDAVQIREIPKIGRNAVNSNELFIDNLIVPVADRIGEEGRGFYYLLDGLNPERILVAAEAVGLGRDALRRAVAYAKDRVVFDRPIGQNQGIQFPLADSWSELECVDLLWRKAAWLYDQGLPCGPEANMAKLRGGAAAFTAADRALQTFGGFGYAEEFHIGRLWRDARLLRIAPISENLIWSYIAEHVLGLPRSY